MSRCVRQLKKLLVRLKNCGGVAGILEKCLYKAHENKAVRKHGTASFPTAEERDRQRRQKYDTDVKFSILVPVWNNDPEYQRQMMDSVLNQTYENWELCLADGSAEGHEALQQLCLEYAKRFPGRILYKKLDRNMGIAGNTNACLEMATGEYIALLDQDDILHPCALYYYREAIEKQHADYLYSDEVTFTGASIDNIDRNHFKPDYAPDNLLANNYICHFSAFHRNLLAGDEVFRPAYDGSQDHDLILRLTARAQNVVHIPRVLYYWRNHATSVASGLEAKPYVVDAAKRAIADRLSASGFCNFEIESTRAFDTIFRIRYDIKEQPTVSVVLLGEFGETGLQKAIRVITEKSSYEGYNIWHFSHTLSATEQIVNGKTVHIVPVNDVADNSTPVGLAEFCNLAASRVDGQYIVFVRGDIIGVNADWMESLLMYAMRDDVGAVGGKVLYANHRISHAGLLVGTGGTDKVAYAFHGQPEENLGYMGRLCYAQNITAAAAECMMVQREKFAAAGGMNRKLRATLCEADFCLKLRDKGYLNIFTPFAEIRVAQKGKKRKVTGDEIWGYRTPAINDEGSATGMLSVKGTDGTDPYFNPNFDGARTDFALK